MIGLTQVGFGTSVPELMTSLFAAFDGLPGIAPGNLIGSNILNISGIFGITAVVHPLSVPADMLGLNMWVPIGAATAPVLMMLTLTPGPDPSHLAGLG